MSQFDATPFDQLISGQSSSLGERETEGGADGDVQIDDKRRERVVDAWLNDREQRSSQ